MINNDTDSVGQALRKARESKGWSMEEAAKRTKLKVDAIRKMEADEFELLPNVPNARGFVRIYARELGLNGWELMRNFADAPEMPLDGLDLRPEDLEAIPKRTQPPVATSQGIGMFVIFLILAGAVGLIGLKLYQIWPSQGSGDLTDGGAGPVESIPAVETPRGQPVAPLEVKAVPVQGIPEASPVPRAQPMAPAATPLPAVPVATPVETVPTAVPAASINRLRLLGKPGTQDADRFVRVTARRDGAEVILYADILNEGTILPDPSMPAWEADQFIVLFRETAAVQIIFNETNFGSYDVPGVQTVRLPAE
ncbi:MAG: helix-turn-helix domain-containing protein [Candidatus Methylacidiphilales bacterium]